MGATGVRVSEGGGQHKKLPSHSGEVQSCHEVQLD